MAPSPTVESTIVVCGPIVQPAPIAVAPLSVTPFAIVVSGADLDRRVDRRGGRRLEGDAARGERVDDPALRDLLHAPPGRRAC